LGEHYKVDPIDIDSYDLVDVIGDKEGILNSTDTEVTFMYQPKQTITITVKYVDKITNEELIPSSSMTTYTLTSYEVDLKDIDGYSIVDKTTNYKGIAGEEDIEVIIYYEPIVEPEVKGEEENPKTGDTIYRVVIIGIFSIIGLILSCRNLLIKNS